MDYSVVVPAYNEERVIGKNLRRLHGFLSGQNKTFEIILADDGSVDNTSRIAEQESRELGGIRILRERTNKGRGSVLSRAFMEAKGDLCFYIDADLSIDLNLLPKLADAINSGFDVAVGSKNMSYSDVSLPSIRRLVGKGYSFLARILFGMKIYDYQCGFKAFRKEILKEMLPHIKSKRWFWDTEFLVKSASKGYKIKEIPAKVKEIPGRRSKVHLVKDIFFMGLSLARLKSELGKIKNFPKFINAE